MLSAGVAVSIQANGDGTYAIKFSDTGNYNAFVVWFKGNMVFDNDEARYTFDPVNRGFDIQRLI